MSSEIPIADWLRSMAQNEFMIDRYFLEEGVRLNEAADEIERLHDVIADSLSYEAANKLEAEKWQAIKERDNAMEAARYMRVVLTNMTQDEQMQQVYARWPWLKGE